MISGIRYLGSKRRIAKYIMPIILRNRKEGQWYVEPFVGGCNSIIYATGNCIGNDIHRELIVMYKAIQAGWLPPEHITKEMYVRCREGKESPELTAYVGFCISFGGKWFAGYANDAYRRTCSYMNILQLQLFYLITVIFVVKVLLSPSM